MKKSKRFLRSVIKLDKNFHIYVHSRPDNIERGYDENKGKGYAESSRSPEFLQKKEAVEPLQKGMGTSPKK